MPRTRNGTDYFLQRGKPLLGLYSGQPSVEASGLLALLVAGYDAEQVRELIRFPQAMHRSLLDDGVSVAVVVRSADFRARVLREFDRLVHLAEPGRLRRSLASRKVWCHFPGGGGHL